MMNKTYRFSQTPQNTNRKTVELRTVGEKQMRRPQTGWGSDTQLNRKEESWPKSRGHRGKRPIGTEVWQRGQARKLESGEDRR